MKIKKGDWIRTLNGVCLVKRFRSEMNTENMLVFEVYYPETKIFAVVMYSNIFEKIDINDYPEYKL